MLTGDRQKSLYFIQFAAADKTKTFSIVPQLKTKAKRIWATQ